MTNQKTNRLITIRDVEPGDHAFLFSTYLQNNWYDQTQTTTLKKHMWMTLQHNRLEKILKEKTVKIACLTEDSDVLIGYCFSDGEKPFIYIKKAWRQPALNLTKLLTEALEA